MSLQFMLQVKMSDSQNLSVQSLNIFQWLETESAAIKQCCQQTSTFLQAFRDHERDRHTLNIQ